MKAPAAGAGSASGTGSASGSGGTSGSEAASGAARKGAPGDKVFFTGPIYNRDELRAWNTRGDIFLFPSTFDTNGLVVREAAACGLASILIKDSCAAEGITDDRNGFIIEESAEAMAQLLMKLCKDMDHVHDVGQHAMDEIYMSWSDVIGKAYDRYEYVLARSKVGAMPHRKKQVTDFMVELTAKTMEEQDKMRKKTQEEQEKLRRKFNETFNDLRGRAIATYEETKAATDTAKLLWSDIVEDLWTDVEEIWKP